MAGVMVDTNIFYILLLGSIEEARRVAEILEGKKLYTTPTVIAELLHLLSYRYLKKKRLVKGSLSLKKWIRNKGYRKKS